MAGESNINMDSLHFLTDSTNQQRYSECPVRWVRCVIPACKRERIVRCSRLQNEDEIVSNLSRLSFCPSHLLKEGIYNRCSIPKQEMFYGTLYGEEEDEITHALMTSIFEISSLCHETTTEDEYYVCGEWIATKDIITLVIFDHTKPASNSFFRGAKQRAEQYLVEHPEDTIGDLTLIEAFSREVTNNCDYRITAEYSDYLFRTFSIDAIVYPSVRTGEVGTCIAISPSFVKSGGLELIATSKYKLYSEGFKKINGKVCQRGFIDKVTGQIRYERI